MLKPLICTSILIAFILFTGCGSSNKTTPVDNTSQPENELGFYGKDVLFGGQKLFGYWEGNLTNLDTNNSFLYRVSFRNDGVFSEAYSGEKIGYSFYGYYGVDRVGNSLFLNNLYTSDYNVTFIYVFKAKRLDSCIELDMFFTNELEMWGEGVLCPTATDKTPLLSGVNIGKTINAFGYYGPDVKFGNTTIVGEWRYATLDENGSISIYGMYADFYQDGTFMPNVDFTEITPYGYGINEEGNRIHFGSNGYDKILETINDSCYKIGSFLYADDSLDSSYIMCKVSE